MDQYDLHEPQTIAEKVELPQPSRNSLLANYWKKLDQTQPQQKTDSIFSLVPSLRTVSIFSLGGILFLTGIEIVSLF